MEIERWAKTSDANPVIEGQKPFCIAGVVWQGFGGVCVRCTEDTMTEEELERVQDLDGTMNQVWQRRKDRVDGRLQRKRDEYDKRIAKLRAERNDIRQSMREDLSLGLKASEVDAQDAQYIEKRILRLREGSAGLETSQRKIEEALAPPPTGCSVCGAPVPEGSEPKRWLRMHTLGKHRDRSAPQTEPDEASEVVAEVMRRSGDDVRRSS